MNAPRVLHAFLSLAEYAAQRALPDKLDVNTDHVEQWSEPPTAFPEEPLSTCLSALRGQFSFLPHVQQPALEAHLQAALSDRAKADWGAILKLLAPVVQSVLQTVLAGALGA